MDVASALKKTPIFEGLPMEHIEEIASFARSVTFPRKTLVFTEGDPVSGFYVVWRGTVAVFKTSEEGKEQILHIVEPPHTFAEAAVFGGPEYPASSRVLTDSTLIFIPKKEFLALLKENPEISFQIVRSLSLWLRRMVDLVEDLTLRDVEARFVKFVRERAGREGTVLVDGAVVRLDVEKSVIASKIHAVPETFSRMLRRLSEKGAIEVKGPHITILDASLFKEED